MLWWSTYEYCCGLFFEFFPQFFAFTSEVNVDSTKGLRSREMSPVLTSNCVAVEVKSHNICKE